MFDIPKTPISDAPQSVKDMITDPGFTVLAGFGALLLGMLVVLLNTQLIPIYSYFAAGVVGLITGHCVTDSNKLKYICNQNKDVSNG